MKPEEARALLKEYDSLPDDLNTRLNWNGYKRLPVANIHCACGHIDSFPVDLDDLRWRVEHNQLEFHTYKEKCYGHEDEEPQDEENSEDEEE